MAAVIDIDMFIVKFSLYFFTIEIIKKINFGKICEISFDCGHPNSMLILEQNTHQLLFGLNVMVSFWLTFGSIVFQIYFWEVSCKIMDVRNNELIQKKLDFSCFTENAVFYSYF